MSEEAVVIQDFDIDALLDSLAERVAAKLGDRGSKLNQAGVERRLLTVEQAGVYIGRTTEAVEHMIAANKLPVVRPDRRVFLDVRDLDRWIDANKT